MELFGVFSIAVSNPSPKVVSGNIAAANAPFVKKERLDDLFDDVFIVRIDLPGSRFE
jgi:hypothetical protein